MKIKFALLSYITLILSSCITGGTHGSIKSYEYPVSKSVLEKAVWKVIAANSNIKRSIAKYVIDSTKNDYYNDGIYYVSMTITKGEFKNNYTFQFAGDSIYWNTSKVSDISIAYAWDKDANGGHEGISGKVKKQLVSLFELEFINKIDKELYLKYSETK